MYLELYLEQINTFIVKELREKRKLPILNPRASRVFTIFSITLLPTTANEEKK